MKVELNETDLYLNGLATDHIWLMETGPESHPIGVRLDCGDSGVVYLSRSQAKDLAEQLLDFAATPATPTESVREVAAARLSYEPRGGDAPHGWLEDTYSVMIGEFTVYNSAQKAAAEAVRDVLNKDINAEIAKAGIPLSAVAGCGEGGE